ncbi:MAG: hypothetical protein Q9225_000827 [Loekoesia sp. 1 TL-2023]
MSSPIALKKRNAATSVSLRSQWSNPSDILSLLLLIGGDVIRIALAQQTGDTFPTPVVFSFGWVAYAFTAILSAVSNDRLMPGAPDTSVVVSSTGFGHPRANLSWILGRLVRDFESYWMPDFVRRDLEDMLREIGKPKAGLCVTVFEASSDAVAGVPKRDIYWYSGYLVAMLQLVIAIIPWAIWDEWEVFVVTAAGTLLAFAMGSLPRWREERWNCRRATRKNFTLSRGNGSQNVLVILGEGRGLDLEDLAGFVEGVRPLGWKRLLIAFIAVLWMVLLITVSGIKQHTWFLVAVGTVGMVHTIIITGAPRKPEWFGVHLKYRDHFVRKRVIDALKALDETYPGIGRSMLPTFFPNGVRGVDADWAAGKAKPGAASQDQTKS